MPPRSCSAVRAATGSLGLVELLLASVVLGIVDTFRGRSRSRTSSTWRGRRVRRCPGALEPWRDAFGAVGAAVGGVVLDLNGPAPAFLVAAAVGDRGPGFSSPAAQAGTRQPPDGPNVDLRRAMTLLFRNRPVALVTLVTILGEVLGFASLTLFPTFARDVLHTDAAASAR